MNRRARAGGNSSGRSKGILIVADQCAYAAGAVFEVENTGGRPVRIKEVAASCGCATPRVSRSVIEPGTVANIEVQTTPGPVGEQVLFVDLRTNSPLTPVVRLRLRTFGGRDPPFLLQSGGDLIYRAESFQSETREVTALTVESPDSKRNPPLIKSELPFLEFSPPDITERPYAVSTSVLRTYRFKVSFSTPPRIFSGDVLIVDPWDPQHVDRIHVQGETLPSLRVAPSRLILRAESSVGRNRLSSKLFVSSRVPIRDISAVAEPEGTSPLSIGRPDFYEEGRRASFSVGLKPGEPVREGEFRIIVRQSPSSAERIVVPVLVQKEDLP